MTRVYEATAAAEYHCLMLRDDPRYVLERALEDANDIRRALAIGDGVLPELPKGHTGASTECVLARALSNGWFACVGHNEARIYHPQKGKAYQDVTKSTEALEAMGFIRVYTNACRAWSSLSDRPWRIVIPCTWAMANLVRLFDDGQFPDLILE